MRIAVGFANVRGVEIPEGDLLRLFCNQGPNLEFTHQLRWVNHDTDLGRVAIYLTEMEFKALATQFEEASQNLLEEER